MSKPDFHLALRSDNKTNVKRILGTRPGFFILIKKILPIIAIYIAGTASALANFSSFHYPTLPGQRQATAILDLKGSSIDRIKVTVVFSDNLNAVSNAFNVEARQPAQFTESRATVTDLGNGTAACSFIFPHRDAPGGGGPIYNYPKMVHYAWSERPMSGDSPSELTSNSPVRSFVMPRFLIIGYIGDSYAAGEGAPNIEGATVHQRWTDRDCHRSERSGGVLAIEQLKALHPELSVRYDNVTCSGATVANLNVEFQDTRGSSRAPQLLQLKTWLQSEEKRVVDILLADGGGNTAGFGPAGAAILIPPRPNIVENEEVKTRLQMGLATLPGAYNTVIQDLATERYFSVGRVVWMTYPTSLNDKEGHLCGPNTVSGATGVFDCWTPIERGIKSNELTYIKVNLFDPLNAAVRNAVNAANLVAAQGGPYWDLVSVESLSQKNGLCNCRETDPMGYFNTVIASFKRQFDQFGTLHPNATGYRRIYRDAVVHQLEQSIALWHNEVTEQRKRTGVLSFINATGPGLGAGSAARAKHRSSAEPPPAPMRMPRHMGTPPKLEPEDRLPVRPRVPDRPDK